ncbi:MAG: long-chain-fatty-acid--CoA ligase [Lautropia sp.]
MDARAPITPPQHPDAWPPGAPRTLELPRRSLWSNLVETAARQPDKAALVFLGTRTTFSQLQARAERLAGWLRARGVGRGDRVLLFAQNSPQFVIAFFAILRADAVVVPVNPMNKAGELGHYIVDAGATAAIAASDIAGQLIEANDALEPGARLRAIVVARYLDAVDAADRAGIPPAWLDWMQAPVQAAIDASRSAATEVADLIDAGLHAPIEAAHEAGFDDLAALPYTSGTTGLPKGCMHTHGTLMHNVVASGHWHQIDPDAVGLAVVPMFHITGLVVVLNTAILLGNTLVVMPRWDRRLAADAIARWRVTSWINIPTMVIDLIAMPGFEQCDLSSLKNIGGGGAAMPAAIAERLERQFGLKYAEGYGLTETAAPSHSNPRHRPKRACLGIPVIGTSALVVDPLTLEPMPIGEQGEIVVSGPQVFEGYWKQPQASADVFFEKDGRRWFRTGDLGRVDDEGYFFITDRLKRMINSSGFKVWPAEIEAMLYRHPAIQEVCVIGARDPYRGETVKAVVVLRPEHRGRLDEAAIVEWSRGEMAAYKHPRIVEFVDALPRSGSGKIMWRELQAREDATRPAPAAGEARP